MCIRDREESGIRPDVVAGVSIGAFNGAIIAGNPDRAADALASFWNDISTLSPDLPDESLRQQVACGLIAMFGVPQFFRPRWFMPVSYTHLDVYKRQASSTPTTCSWSRYACRSVS